jgi:hypothetical protein
VSFQVFSNLSHDQILPPNPQTFAPFFDMRSSEMFDDCQHEWLAIDGRRAIRDRPVQPQESCEQAAVANDRIAEVRQFFASGHLACESSEH